MVIKWLESGDGKMAGQIDDDLNELIRMEYVEGYLTEQDKRIWPTLEQLIERHKVPKNTVYRRAKAQGWVEQKNQFHAHYTQLINNKRAEKKAEQSERLDATALQVAQSSLGKVSRRLLISVQAERNEHEEDMTMRELNDLVDAGLKAQKMGKLALGEADAITKVVSDDDIPPSLERLLEQLDDLAEAKSQSAGHTIQ